MVGVRIGERTRRPRGASPISVKDLPGFRFSPAAGLVPPAFLVPTGGYLLGIPGGRVCRRPAGRARHAAARDRRTPGPRGRKHHSCTFRVLCWEHMRAWAALALELCLFLAGDAAKISAAWGLLSGAALVVTKARSFSDNSAPAVRPPFRTGGARRYRLPAGMSTTISLFSSAGRPKGARGTYTAASSSRFLQDSQPPVSSSRGYASP